MITAYFPKTCLCLWLHSPTFFTCILVHNFSCNDAFHFWRFFRLIASFLLIGVYSAPYNSAYFALEADFVPKKQRGKMVDLTRFIICILTAIGQITGGFLFQCISPVLPFIFTMMFQQSYVHSLHFSLHMNQRKNKFRKTPQIT